MIVLMYFVIGWCLCQLKAPFIVYFVFYFSIGLDFLKWIIKWVIED